MGIAAVTYTSIRKNRAANQTPVVPNSTAFFDPTLIKAARKIYRNYCNLNSQVDKKPCGVAINRENHRGQLVFKKLPIQAPKVKTII